MIRVERIRLPVGLRAIARRDPEGGLVIYVSSELSARRQRAAVLGAVGAARRAGWRAGLPVGIGLLGGLGFQARRAAHAVRLRPSAWAAAGAAATTAAGAAAIIVTTGPQPGRPAAAGRPPAPGSSEPGRQHSTSGRPHRHARPVVPSAGRSRGSSSAGRLGQLRRGPRRPDLPDTVITLRRRPGMARAGSLSSVSIV